MFSIWMKYHKIGAGILVVYVYYYYNNYDLSLSFLFTAVNTNMKKDKISLTSRQRDIAHMHSIKLRVENLPVFSHETK